MTDGALRSSPPRRAADERRPACAPGGKRQVSLLAERGRTHGVECKRVDAPVLTPSGRIALADLKLERIAVVYPGTHRYALSERVEVVPLAAVLEGMDGLFPH